MCSSSNIVVDVLDVCLDLISKLEERFKGGFATDGSVAGSLEEGVLEINTDRHG